MIKAKSCRPHHKLSSLSLYVIWLYSDALSCQPLCQRCFKSPAKQQAQESGRQRQLQLTDTLLQLPQLRCTGSRQARHTAGLVVQLAGWLLVELTHTVWLTGTLSFRGWGRVDLEHKAGGYRDGMAARFGDGYGQQAWLRLLVAAAPLLVIATRMCAPGAARPCSVCDKVRCAYEHTGGKKVAMSVCLWQCPQPCSTAECVATQLSAFIN